MAFGWKADVWRTAIQSVDHQFKLAGELHMSGSVKELLAAAHESVPKVTADQARKLIDEEGALLLDVRDASELAQSGKLRMP